ncbi:hypothetical protein HerbRD11066_74300 [Herbidospora sp. RD11066]
MVDGVTWLESLDPDVREAFAKGVRYTQNLHGAMGLGKSWQGTSETSDKKAVETFLDGSSEEWTWPSDGGLRVTRSASGSTSPTSGTRRLWATRRR